MITTQIRNLFIYLFIVGFFFFPNLQTMCIIMGFGLTFFVPKAEGFNYKKEFGYIGVLMVLFCVMYLIGLLYSSDLAMANKVLQVKIPFLIFPFFLPVVFSSNKETNLSYLRVFAFSGIIYVLASILKASYVYFTEGTFGAFFSEQFYFRLLGSQIILHPTYGSVYFNLLFFVACSFLITDIKLFKNKNATKLIITAIASLLFIFFSVSKLGFLVFLINATLLLIYYAIKKKKILVTLLMFFSFVIITIASLYTVKPLKVRFEEAYHELTHKNVNPDDYYMSTGTRLWTWKITNEIIAENKFLGVGTGDFKNILEHKYQDKNMVNFKGLDSHQQYLQTTATVGLFGLFILVLMFGLIFFKAIKTNNVMLFFITLTYFLWGLTESMFERQSGVLFFVFFVYLLSNSIKKTEIQTIEN